MRQVFEQEATGFVCVSLYVLQLSINFPLIPDTEQFAESQNTQHKKREHECPDICNVQHPVIKDRYRHTRKCTRCYMVLHIKDVSVVQCSVNAS